MKGNVVKLRNYIQLVLELLKMAVCELRKVKGPRLQVLRGKEWIGKYIVC